MALSKKRSTVVRKKRVSKAHVPAKKKKVRSRPKRSSALPRRARRRIASRAVRPLRRRFVTIQKHEANPIIEPRPENFWEMKATFNPAAVNVDGHVHLLYRAIGGDDMSTLGYAVSDDGVDDHRTSGHVRVQAPEPRERNRSPRFRRSAIFRAADVRAVRKIRAL